MKLQEILTEQHHAEDLRPHVKSHHYHGINMQSFLKHLGFKEDKEQSSRHGEEDGTIYSGMHVFVKGPQTFYISGSDQLLDDEFHHVHPLHNRDFLHLADQAGFLKRDYHPTKNVTWADFDMEKVKKAGIKVFD